MKDEEEKVEQKAEPKRVIKKRSKPAFSPEEIETRYQAHLKKVGGK
ncbi:MAG: hypothetical protein KAR06_05005 [Deltaproteobacteria bacterium]|nr:hypothetical protein [Deltaproteobacteria bacterium]